MSGNMEVNIAVLILAVVVWTPAVIALWRFTRLERRKTGPHYAEGIDKFLGQGDT